MDALSIRSVLTIRSLCVATIVGAYRVCFHTVSMRKMSSQHRSQKCGMFLQKCEISSRTISISYKRNFLERHTRILCNS